MVELFREGGQPSLAWVFVLAPVDAALIGGVQMVRGFPAAYRLAIAGLVPLSFDPTVPVWAVQVNLIPLTMVIVMLWFRPRPSLPDSPSALLP